MTRSGLHSSKQRLCLVDFHFTKPCTPRLIQSAFCHVEPSATSWEFSDESPIFPLLGKREKNTLQNRHQICCSNLEKTKIMPDIRIQNCAADFLEDSSKVQPAFMEKLLQRTRGQQAMISKANTTTVKNPKKILIELPDSLKLETSSRPKQKTAPHLKISRKFSSPKSLLNLEHLIPLSETKPQEPKLYKSNPSRLLTSRDPKHLSKGLRMIQVIRNTENVNAQISPEFRYTSRVQVEDVKRSKVTNHPVEIRDLYTEFEGWR